MARYIGPVCRLCRRQGEKLMLKGERCATPKCALERKQKPSRQRQRSRPKKLSEYGIRLRESQKAKHIYGILERQFKRHFAEAERIPGLAGENLLRILEMRLDSVVYRLGFADSRRQARQLVRHGHITLNGRKTDIPSCLVKPGDVIAWMTSKQGLIPYQAALQDIGSRHIPGWLSVDDKSLTAKVLTLPSREDIGVTINERLIVEYYSR
ncbi:MAG: 30S ribosomal protein S4 [Dehalococcoidia bacterium]|nr:30S ribosomal protein S4 [Chloroflexota bacterium]MBT9160518.1 30S ribosomal protein S4 [Chloroflexota bacterium]MBT9162155.1 30S ribosomal protein S4 [Chloroflexota bacterium]